MDLHQWELENQPGQPLQMVPCLLLPQSKAWGSVRAPHASSALCAPLPALVPAGAEAWPLLGVL